MNGHRCDILKNDGGCGPVKHFNDSKCLTILAMDNFKFYIIDHIKDIGITDEETKWRDAQLCQRERYWQSQIGTIHNGLNGTKDWYNTSNNRRNWSNHINPTQSNIED